MQRSITYQNTLSTLFWIVAFSFYSALSSIHLFLPPMLAVVGFLFYLALSRHDLFSLIAYSIMLLMIEAEKGFWFGSSIVFFTLISYYLLPKLEQNMRCTVCIKALFVLASYLLFWIFLTMANGILLLPQPSLDWHVLFYMGIEFSVIAIFG
ncbi:MAG: hypothetical protein PHW18_08035 [Sulfuricurvum sp.]|nr:hypothetical protein [Sulfuricurvum sp.]MDD2829505.1 hypothetical protein [Sulfuricurvum sp.]